MAVEPATPHRTSDAVLRRWCEICRNVFMATQYPSKVAGIKGREMMIWGMPNRPTAASIARDMMQLTTKKAARFARIKSFSSCCKTRAMGGPPIAELVPIKPDKNPAENIAVAVGFNMTLARLKPTATMTEMPNHNASALWSIHNSNMPPATVPGILPIIAYLRPANEIDFQNLAAFARDRVSAQIVIGAGTYRGSIKNKSGAAMIARPNPIELWT